MDLAINVSKVDSAQAHEMNKHGQHFGMAGNDFYSFLTDDLEEAETFKLAKEEEHEKALYAGRKSRRERRYVLRVICVITVNAIIVFKFILSVLFKFL